MTDTYRALCAELIDELDYQTSNHEADGLIDRARAALAAEPQPPVDGEVAELVAGIREIAQLWESDAPSSRQLSRAADLLDRLAPQPVPEG